MITSWCFNFAFISITIVNLNKNKDSFMAEKFRSTNLFTTLCNPLSLIFLITTTLTLDRLFLIWIRSIDLSNNITYAKKTMMNCCMFWRDILFPDACCLLDVPIFDCFFSSAFSARTGPCCLADALFGGVDYINNIN